MKSWVEPKHNFFMIHMLSGDGHNAVKDTFSIDLEPEIELVR